MSFLTSSPFPPSLPSFQLSDYLEIFQSDSLHRSHQSEDTFQPFLCPKKSRVANFQRSSGAVQEEIFNNHQVKLFQTFGASVDISDLDDAWWGRGQGRSFPDLQGEKLKNFCTENMGANPLIIFAMIRFDQGQNKCKYKEIHSELFCTKKSTFLVKIHRQTDSKNAPYPNNQHQAIYQWCHQVALRMRLNETGIGFQISFLFFHLIVNQGCNISWSPVIQEYLGKVPWQVFNFIILIQVASKLKTKNFFTTCP